MYVFINVQQFANVSLYVYWQINTMMCVSVSYLKVFMLKKIVICYFTAELF